MPITICTVLTCKSRSDNNEDKNLIFHLFPKNEELCEKWIIMTGRHNWKPNKNSCVCSRHFRDNDYIIKRSGQRYLKTGAIPCEHVVYQNLFPEDMPVPSPDVAEEEESVEDAIYPADVSDTSDDSSDDDSLTLDQLQAGPVDLHPAFHELKKALTKRKAYSRKDYMWAVAKVKAASEEYIKYPHLDETQRLKIVNGLQHELLVQLTLKRWQLKKVLDFVHAALCNIEKNYSLQMAMVRIGAEGLWRNYYEDGYHRNLNSSVEV